MAGAFLLQRSVPHHKPVAPRRVGGVGEGPPYLTRFGGRGPKGRTWLVTLLAPDRSAEISHNARKASDLWTVCVDPADWPTEPSSGWQPLAHDPVGRPQLARE